MFQGPVPFLALEIDECKVSLYANAADTPAADAWFKKHIKKYPFIKNLIFILKSVLAAQGLMIPGGVSSTILFCLVLAFTKNTSMRIINPLDEFLDWAISFDFKHCTITFEEHSLYHVGREEGCNGPVSIRDPFVGKQRHLTPANLL